MTPTLTRRILKWSTAGPMPAYERRCDSSLMDLPETPGSGEPAGHPPARPLCAASLRSRTPERKDMAGSANDGALVHEKGCDLGRTENPASQEFHNFANVTNAIIWEAVAAVTRARISIAKGRLLCEQTRELRVQAQDARNRVQMALTNLTSKSRNISFISSRDPNAQRSAYSRSRWSGGG